MDIDGSKNLLRIFEKPIDHPLATLMFAAVSAKNRSSPRRKTSRCSSACWGTV